ncbi:unnamed protein product [Mucor circinelloides]
MNKENENNFLKSLENKAFEEATFLNLTAINFFQEENKKKEAYLRSIASSSSCPPSSAAEQSTEGTEKELEEIIQYVGEDTIKINNTLVHCGLNCILDLGKMYGASLFVAINTSLSSFLSDHPLFTLVHTPLY